MNNSKREVTRREFLRLSGICTAAVAAVAIPIPSAAHNVDNVQSNNQLTEVTTYKESPMLAERVQRGVLPSIDQRLPVDSPCIIPVLEKIGTYDSVIARGFKGETDWMGPTKMRDHGLVWYTKELGLQARLCKNWSVNDTATEWTFELRPGTRWSDGVPFTADDYVWWFQNELSNTDINPGFPGAWSVNGHPMTLVKVDTYTFKITFPLPYPLFVYKLTRTEPACPSHYMKQYHIDFTTNPAALAAEAVAAGFSNWVEYYLYDRREWYKNPARPLLSPWIAKNTIWEEFFVMERNPYYYGVDAENNQLPYLDTVVHEYFEQDRTFIDWIKAGKIDFQSRHVSFGYYEELKAGELAGNYDIVLGVSASHMTLAPNQTIADTRLREFFQSQNVRIALSLAVDRIKMNTEVFHDLAVPRQYSPISSSLQYYPALSYAHIGYDVARANELLDLEGYTVRDAQNYRLWKDTSGDRIHFTIEGQSQVGSAEEAAVQLAIKAYEAVGIDASYVCLDRGIFNNHLWDNTMQASWWGGGRTVLPLVDPTVFIGTREDVPWSGAWAQWKNGWGSEAPPVGHFIWDLWDLWEQIEVEPNSVQRNLLFQGIMDIWATQLPTISYLGELPAPVVMKKGMKNYSAGYPNDDTLGDENFLNPETYFWETSVPYNPDLESNYNTGSPGSVFGITGNGFPENSTAIVTINGQVLDTLMTDENGGLAFQLNMSNADPGVYNVNVTVNPTITIQVVVENSAPMRIPEIEAPTIVVPEGIATRYEVRMPIITR